MAASKNSSTVISTMSTTQPISLIGAMGLHPQQLQQNISILQKQQQIAALQPQQHASPGQIVANVPSVVVGNQPTVALQNIQVLSGQTFAVASNIQGGIPTQPNQIIRSITPVQASNLAAAHQIRAQSAVAAAVQQQQQQSAAKSVQQVNLTLPIVSNTGSTTSATSSNNSNASSQQQQASANQSASSQGSQALTKRKLQDLLHEIDPTETMDDDVEEVLLHIADDFIENVITASCQLAKHRKSNTLDVKDVQLHLDRNWNMWIPGFGSEDLRPYKKLPSTEAHRQRLALIKKAMKK